MAQVVLESEAKKLRCFLREDWRDKCDGSHCMAWSWAEPPDEQVWLKVTNDAGYEKYISEGFEIEDKTFDRANPQGRGRFMMTRQKKDRSGYCGACPN